MYPLPLLPFLLLPFALTQALKFELYAQPQAQLTQRCIRNFVNRDTLVVVTAIVSGSKGDGQRVNIDVLPLLKVRLIREIRDTQGNEYGRPKDVAGEQRMAFTPHGETNIEVCFENILGEGSPTPFLDVLVI